MKAIAVRFRALEIAALTVAVLLAAADHSCASDEPATAELATEVRQLISDLDADRLATRRKAERRLLEIGPRVLPHFPPPELVPQPGVRQILARLRIQLERRQARQSAEASQVTATGRYPLRELLQNITRQTGNRIDAAKLPEEVLLRAADIDFHKTPFWKAMDDVCGRWQLQYGLTGMSDAVILKPADGEPDRAVTYSGPFRLALSSLQARPESDDLRMSMGILAEPRIRPLFLAYRADDWKATTADNRVIGPRSPGAQWDLPMGAGGRYAGVLFDFAAAPPAGDEITVDGKFTMTTAVSEQPIRFTDLPRAQGVARRRGGVTVKLTEVESQKTKNDKYDLRITAAVMYDAGGPAFESHRTWIYHNRVYLVDKDGNRVEFGGDQRTSLTRDGAVLIEYPFPDLDRPAADYEFVYVAPTLIVTLPISFQFNKATVDE